MAFAAAVRFLANHGKDICAMKIGLASYEFRNNDIPFNLAQMERAMRSVQGSANLLCFGETFLQGFDALSWRYERDRDIAVSMDSPLMERICGLTLQYGVDLLFGYIEGCGTSLYSSCAVVEKGRLLHNYRRISRGWKEYAITDAHYWEGSDTGGFLYRGMPVTIALCGDLWDFPERFQTDYLLIWPVYVNFTLDEWARYEPEYASQARLAARKTLLVNSISQKPASHGGAFYFTDGKTEKKLPFDMEDILVIDI